MHGGAADGGKLVVATVYPLYVAALNIIDGADGVSVELLASPTGGCLHDYQLTTGDRLLLERCGALVRNGVGLEPFLDKVIGERAGMEVITASDGYGALIEDVIENEPGYNPHIWVSPKGMIFEARVIADALGRWDAANAALYAQNAAAYIDKLEALDAEIAAALAPYEGAAIVTFHNSFPYFARDYGLHIAAVVEREPGAAPSARELADAARIMAETDARAIFIEPQYDGRAAQTLSAETGVAVYTLDSAVTGALGDRDAYINIMKRNTGTLTEALVTAE